jgi:hypothetical protein
MNSSDGTVSGLYNVLAIAVVPWMKNAFSKLNVLNLSFCVSIRVISNALVLF